MLRRIAVLLASGVVLVSASACGGLGRPSTETIDEYDIPTSVAAVDVRADTGQVEIVAVTGRFRVVERRNFTDNKPRTAHRTEGDTFFITDDGCVKDGITFSGRCETHFRIEVPAGVNVTVAADAAGISVQGITGTLNLKSDVGDVDGSGLAGATEVRAQVGTVDLQFATPPPSVLAASEVGDVTLRLPRTGQYRFDSAAENGKSSIELPNDQAATATVTMRTNVGSVVARAA
jgi:hypothetical protein